MAEKGTKPTWLMVLESPFILVFVAGIFGQCITGMIQDKARQRDLRAEWVKGEVARRNEGLAQVEQRQLAMADTVFARFSRVMASTDDMVRLRRDYWDPEIYLEPAKATVLRQRSEFRKAFNRDSDIWRRSAMGLGASLDHAYTKGDQGLFDTWLRLGDAVDRYVDVTDSTMAEDRPKDPITRAEVYAERDRLCRVARDSVTTAAVNVTQFMRSHRVLQLTETKPVDELAKVLELDRRWPF